MFSLSLKPDMMTSSLQNQKIPVQKLIKYHIVPKSNWELSNYISAWFGLFYEMQMSLGISHPLWKAAAITTPMQRYKSSHTMPWLYFGLLPFLFQHRKQGFLKTLCYIMEVIAVFSYLVFGLWLRKILGENSEIKCSSGRSCCLSWK